MFLAALTSRSWTAPHGQAHDRTFSGMDSASAPQAEHSLLLGNQRSIFTRVRPYRAALYSSMLTNADHPASCTDLASRVRARPFTHKSSTITAWFSRMIRVESWWVKSRRASATLAWARATRATALVRLFDPFALRDRAFCALRNRRSARRRNRGLPTFRPSESTAKCDSPDSHLGGRLRQRLGGGLDDERGEVPARRVLDHSDAGGLGREAARPLHRNVADLRQAQSPARCDREA